MKQKLFDDLPEPKSYIMSVQDQAYLMNQMSASAPSDIIYLDEKTKDKLHGIYIEGKLEHIPSDIFFERTIPIHDLILNIEGICTGDENNVGVSARIIVFEDYSEILSRLPAQRLSSDINIENAIGMVSLELSRPGHGFHMHVITPFYAKPGEDSIFGRDWHYIGLPEIYGEERRRDMDRILQTNPIETREIFQDALATWYTVQVSLLHPLTHTVFEHYQTENSGGKDKLVLPKDEYERVVKYVRHHHVKPEDFEFNLDDLGIPRDEQRKYTRKTLVWHVAGHWSHFHTKDGQVEKFVQGYWKGPLRDYQKNLDKQRRVVAV